MSLLSFISVFSAALALVMGVVVLQQDKRDHLHRVFFLLCMMISFIGFAEYGYRQAEGGEIARFWLKASQCAPLIIPMIAYFAIVFTGSIPAMAHPYALALLFIPAIVFCGVDTVTDTISGTPQHTAWGWGQSLVNSPWFHAYAAWSTLLLALSALLTIRFFSRAVDLKKRAQARYVALAVTLIMIITVVIDTGMNYFKVQLPECSTLGYALANLLIAYAIRRHRLFVLSPAAASDTILETISDALFLVAPEGRITYVNKAARMMFNADSGLFTGNRLSDFVVSATPLLKELSPGIWGIGKLTADVPATASLPLAGRRIPLSVAGKTMIDDKGAVLGTVVTVRDISERVNAEAALRESHDLLEERVRQRTGELNLANASLAAERERLAITLRSIGDGVISCDLDGKVLFINDMAQQLTGWTPAEALGMHVREIMRIRTRGESASPLDPVREPLHSGRRIELLQPVVLETRDGEQRIIDDSAAPILLPDGTVTGAVIVFRDVTGKEQLEEELFRAKRMESVALLAGGIAHDFNNLLTGIGNNLFMCKMSAHGNADVVTIVNETEREVLRAQKLAMQLLTFAQGGEPVLEVCSPRRLIEGSIGFFMSGSSCAYDLQFDEHLMNIRMDRAMMEQVISNLVINAEQAMPNGGTVFITVGNAQIDENHLDGEKKQPVPLPQGTYVRINVRDTGTGIPHDIRDKIFDPFFSTKGKGRGLGLSITRSVVVKHGGVVVVDQSIAEGASFLLYLPAVEDSAPEQIELPQGIPHLEETAQERILLMDDEPVVRKSTGRILEMMGYRVVTAENGEEAIKLFGEAERAGLPFDLVVLDLTVPGGMGGRECIGKLAEINPRVRSVVSSGYSTDAVMSNHAAYGFSGVLRKPYSAERLRECIKEVLG